MEKDLEKKIDLALQKIVELEKNIQINRLESEKEIRGYVIDRSDKTRAAAFGMLGSVGAILALLGWFGLNQVAKTQVEEVVKASQIEDLTAQARRKTSELDEIIIESAADQAIVAARRDAFNEEVDNQLQSVRREANSFAADLSEWSNDIVKVTRRGVQEKASEANSEIVDVLNSFRALSEENIVKLEAQVSQSNELLGEIERADTRILKVPGELEELRKRLNR